MAVQKIPKIPDISFSDGLAIGGVVLTVVLLVLDKAGKLKGPILFWLLAFAALMTMPLVLGNSWVSQSQNGVAKGFRIVFLVCVVGAGYAALSAWIATGGDSSMEEAALPKDHGGAPSSPLGSSPAKTQAPEAMPDHSSSKPTPPPRGHRSLMSLNGGESEAARRAEILATPFEDAWIGVSFQTTDVFINQFNRKIDDKYLEWFKKEGYINVNPSLSQGYYNASWNSTFGSVLPCSPFGISSDMDFRISLHPPLNLHVSNLSINAICAVEADLFGHEQWLGLSSNGYILDSPAMVTTLMPEPQNRGHFSLRFPLTARIMRGLSEDIPSTWKSFMIDTPAEIQLAIGSRVCWRPGRYGPQIIDCTGSEPDALQSLKQDRAKAESMFPQKITLTTELTGGPMSIREYTFVPGLDPTIHGTGMYYRWKLTRYDEVKGFLYGGGPPPPSSTQPKGPR